MPVKIVLVDVNPKMIAAWRSTFEENPEVEVVQGSMLDQEVDAWVTPTNARASMDGGLDGVIKGHFGPAIERRVQAEIKRRYGGLLLPVGHATCVPTGAAQPSYLISTPTMTGLVGGHQRHAERGPGLRRGVPGGPHAERPRAGEHRLDRPARPGGQHGAGAGRDLRRPDVDRLQPLPSPRLRRLRRHACRPGGRARRPRPGLRGRQAEGQGQGRRRPRPPPAAPSPPRRRRPRRRRARGEDVDFDDF